MGKAMFANRNTLVFFPFYGDWSMLIGISRFRQRVPANRFLNNKGTHGTQREAFLTYSCPVFFSTGCLVKYCLIGLDLTACSHYNCAPVMSYILVTRLSGSDVFSQTKQACPDKLYSVVLFLSQSSYLPVLQLLFLVRRL